MYIPGLNKNLSNCLLQVEEETPLVQPKMLFPVIKLTEEKTDAPWEIIPTPAVVIRLQDLLQRNGKHFSPIFNRIRETGGIHNFLGWKSRVILSTVMRDETLFGCSVDNYLEAISGLQPDFFMTLDGETYEDEPHLAAAEVDRILSESKEIISKRRNSIPLGLVKGSNLEQIGACTESLKELGLKTMVFHSGDFICSGNERMINRARQYAKYIRENSIQLLLYGIGSEKHFRKFHFADAFITQSHYVCGFYHQKYVGGKWIPQSGKPDRKWIMENLKGLFDSVQQLNNHQMDKRLITWAEEIGAIDHHMPQPDRAMIDYMPKINLGV